MSDAQNDGEPDTACLYAWLSRDETGEEGIIAMPLDGVIFPLVLADRDRAERLAGSARIAASLRGEPARLVRFDRAETLQTIAPTAAN